MKGRILIVDDKPDFFDPLVEELEARHYIVKNVDRIRDARDIFLNGGAKYDLILVDLVFGENRQEKQGLAFIGWLEESEYDIKKIIVTYDNEQETAVKAFKEFQIEHFFNKDKIDIAKWLHEIISIIDHLKRNGNGQGIQGNIADQNHPKNELYPSQPHAPIEEHCRSLIAKDRVLDCIRILLENDKTRADSESRDDLNALSGRWVSNEKNRTKGTLRDADYKVEKETIRQGTLEIIKRLEPLD